MRVRVCLSSVESSFMGQALCQLHYTQRLKDLYLLAPDAKGCPHSGGVHTFTMTGEHTHVIAWLNLFAEEYPILHVLLRPLFKEIRDTQLNKPMGATRLNHFKYIEPAELWKAFDNYSNFQLDQTPIAGRYYWVGKDGKFYQPKAEYIMGTTRKCKVLVKTEMDPNVLVQPLPQIVPFCSKGDYAELSKEVMQEPVVLYMPEELFERVNFDL